MDRLSKHVETQKSFNVELKSQHKKLESRLAKADAKGGSSGGGGGGGGGDKELAKQNAALQARVKELEVKVERGGGGGGSSSKAGGGESAKEAKLKSQIDEIKKTLAEKENKIKELTKDLKAAASEGNAAAAADKLELKKKDKQLKELEKKMEMTEKKLAKTEETTTKLTESQEALEAEMTALKADHAKCAPEIEALQQLAEKGNEFGAKAQKLEQELKELRWDELQGLEEFGFAEGLAKGAPFPPFFSRFC